MDVRQVRPPRSTSTSRHGLNADGSLSKTERILWIAYNLFNNSFPRSYIDATPNKLKFSLTELQLNKFWDDTAATASLARRLCDLFWMYLPWGALSNELGNVTALKVGCGTGVYGRLLETCLGHSFKQYVDVDIEAQEH
jgi:hypothetical protein